MEPSFLRSVVLTLLLAAAVAGAIQAARHMGTSVQESMDAGTIKERNARPTPRRF
ncbi:MAG TPA: hypothetical protein VF585_08765 [Chthoniobacterales bacterium]|jgi:hypothetical protein